MSIIIPLPRKNVDAVWSCNCGCISHTIYTDGRLECAACGDMFEVAAQAHGDWLEHLPLPEKIVRRDVSEVVVRMGEAPQALSRTLGLAGEDTTSVVIIAQNNGDVHVWGGGFTEEFLEKALNAAKGLIAKLMKAERDDDAAAADDNC